MEKVLEYVSMVHDLCTVLGMDFLSTVTEVHPSLDDSIADNCKSISDDTLSKLDKTVATLHEDKKLRLSKVKIKSNFLKSEAHALFYYMHNLINGLFCILSFKSLLVNCMIFGISWMLPHKKGACLIMLPATDQHL